jgi:hypothetical protein
LAEKMAIDPRVNVPRILKRAESGRNGALLISIEIGRASCRERVFESV